jgi:ATP-dependent helicase HrpB
MIPGRTNLTFAIENRIPDLRAALSTSRRVVLTAPPGAGKSVRVPLALLECDWLAGKKILMLEPRRLAARRAAEFMALQLGERTGLTVGYRIRGTSVIGRRTRIEVVTEGILTRMLHTAPDLPEAGLVIFDEFHERSIHADLGLAFALDVQRHLRDDLRLLLMSATLDGVAVSGLLPDAPVVRGEASTYPVQTIYSGSSSGKSLEQRIADGIGRALDAGEGDLLVFLPGMREIRRVEELLSDRPKSDMLVCLLHGDLAVRVQEAALAPAAPGARKVILSTSIAETSLTIPGVRMVLDSGLARASRFDPRRGMSSLVTIPVSRAQADQRRGRAGRTAPGLCFRMWSESDHAGLPEFPLPEIRTSDLAHLALDLALWGSPDGENLSFIDPPPPAHIARARELLAALGAVDPRGSFTPHGSAMAALSVHPRLGHMILKAKEAGWGAAACELAALLEEGGLQTAGNGPLDVAAHLDAFHQESAAARRGGRSVAVERIAAQQERLRELAQIGGEQHVDPPYGLLLAWAYPDRIARRRPDLSGWYNMANGASAVLPETDPLTRQEYIAVAEVDGSALSTGPSAVGRIYMAAALERDHLFSAFADELEKVEEVVWDDREKRVQARRLTRLGALIVEESAVIPAPGQCNAALIEGIRRTGLHCLPWEKEALRFRARAQWIRCLRPEWPGFDDNSLASDLTEWLLPHLDGITRLEQLQRLRLADILRSRLSPLQYRELELLAPAHLTVSSGSRIALDYPAVGHPVLAVKLQELFGMTETPRIGGGTVTVTIHLLSPASRPLAVTQDLRSFWIKLYPEIRKQLRARYPKHPWPEDPFTAEPTRKTLRAGR